MVLAQAYVWTKTKGFYQSCTLRFLGQGLLLSVGLIMFHFSALIISGGWSSGNVSLVQLDPLSGQVVSDCSLPDMPGSSRSGHSMDGDLACGGTQGHYYYYYMYLKFNNNPIKRRNIKTAVLTLSIFSIFRRLQEVGGMYQFVRVTRKT